MHDCKKIVIHGWSSGTQIILFSLLDVLGTVDLIEKGTNSVVFRTCPEEKSQAVFQMGTSDAVRALNAAQMV